MKDLLAELSELLVRQSIRYGKFRLASGAESHYFCDTKLTLLSPRGSQLCGEALCRVLECSDVEAVGGCATACRAISCAIL